VEPDVSDNRSDDDGKPPRIVWMAKEADTPKPRRFQFRLIELFAVVTVACIAFAALGAWGVNGTLDRIEVAAVIASPVIAFFEFWNYWRQNHEA
jgi:hypothetical protein